MLERRGEEGNGVVDGLAVTALFVLQVASQTHPGTAGAAVMLQKSGAGGDSWEAEGASGEIGLDGTRMKANLTLVVSQRSDYPLIRALCQVPPCSQSSPSTKGAVLGSPTMKYVHVFLVLYIPEFQVRQFYDGRQ